MPNHVDASRGPTRDIVTLAAAFGAVTVGVALFEAALIPGLVIGGAAVLAPKYLPKLSRHLPRLFSSPRRRPATGINSVMRRSDTEPRAAAPTRVAIKQALAKTVTFQIIVTTLDFTTNYIVIGELAAAAGLSAFALVARPVFYLVHETAWDYFGASLEQKDGQWGTSVEVPLSFSFRPRTRLLSARRRGFMINRALAKTITFRTIATTMDFAATYVVVGNLATAAALSSVGLVVGPFVYLGHEMAWDYYGSSKARRRDAQQIETKLLPAPI